MSRVSGKPYCLYVLWSETGTRFYIGVSDDPEHRLRQHNAGKRGWTKRYCPWVIVYTEQHDNYRSARKREIELKSQKGGEGFFKRTGLNSARFRKSGS